jgi:hypothetical protein
MGEASPSGFAPRSPWRVPSVTPPAPPRAPPSARRAHYPDRPAHDRWARSTGSAHMIASLLHPSNSGRTAHSHAHSEQAQARRACLGRIRLGLGCRALDDWLVRDACRRGVRLSQRSSAVHSDVVHRSRDHRCLCCISYDFTMLYS